MSKLKVSSPEGNSVLLWLFAVALVANLVLAIFTLGRVSRLHMFYDTFSADYRSLGNRQAGAPVAEGNSPPTVDDPSPAAGTVEEPAITCVDRELDLSSDPSIGDPNAPVTIVEYSDFECPFCARFVTGAYPRIKSNYVDTGKVRIVYKDFPLDHIHPLAVPAALVGSCIAREFGDQVFFAYHDLVYLQQTSLSESTIDAWARDLGLSDEQLNSCRNDPTMVDEIFADRDEGSGVGITGTPSFVINGELVVGAQSFEIFEQSIENALAGQGCEI